MSLLARCKEKQTCFSLLSLKRSTVSTTFLLLVVEDKGFKSCLAPDHTSSCANTLVQMRHQEGGRRHQGARGRQQEGGHPAGLYDVLHGLQMFQHIRFARLVQTKDQHLVHFLAEQVLPQPIHEPAGKGDGRV